MSKKRVNSVVLSDIMGRVRCEPGWRLEAGWSAGLVDFDLWLVWSGRGKMRLSDREIDLHPGTCVWMRPGRRYEAWQNPNDRLGVSFAHFTMEGSADIEPPFEVAEVRSLEFAQAAMSEVVRLGPGEPKLAANVLGGLLAVLAHDEQELATRLNTPGGHPRSRHDAAMEVLAARIVEEPGRQWRIQELAQAQGIAVDYFSRLFRDVMGERPQSYILRNRMARAQHLLRETHLSVGEISHVLGFRDSFYFSRQFRTFYGAPPSIYRRRRFAIPTARDESSA
ncbi:MAG: helix-turn-helix transcriptional regulator [Opitutaceae bacterium]|nr:helix-turn-helix transcriptional regulator [Opitutaceae bacterium]